MALVNENYLKLSEYFFFNDLEGKINAYKLLHPEAKLIRMGRGDVSQAIPEEAAKAMADAAKEMGVQETFRGYGPETGYKFLKDKIIKFDYNSFGIQLEQDEVFVSDGSKSDVGNIGHIFGRDNIIAITDPVYPVYENAAIMGGRSGHLAGDGLWSNIVYLGCTAENGFKPALPENHVDIIYLCYPNNPTGIALTKAELKKWVDYALDNQAIIIFDGAYCAYIREKDIPHSIYEIKGAKKCAIEIRSYSKTGGFTGLRCSYTIVPHELMGSTETGEDVEVNKLWNRRATTYYNGTSYIVQRGAEALYSKKGREQCRALTDYYLENCKIIRDEMTACGFEVYGGVNAPHLWIKTPGGRSSWRFFQEMLYELGVVCTPGAGFGNLGEGYFRFTGFNQREAILEAMERIKNWKGY